MTIKIGIIDLEASARQRNDRTSNIHIRKGHYLIVKFHPHDGNHAAPNPAFTYHWGHVKLSRDGAVMLMSEVDKYVV